MRSPLRTSRLPVPQPGRLEICPEAFAAEPFATDPYATDPYAADLYGVDRRPEGTLHLQEHLHEHLQEHTRDGAGARSRPRFGRHITSPGTLESVAALVATIVFGLGWAAIELGQVEGAGSGYDSMSAGPSRTTPPSHRIEDERWMNETLYERAARSSKR